MGHNVDIGLVAISSREDVEELEEGGGIDCIVAAADATKLVPALCQTEKTKFSEKLIGQKPCRI